MVIQKNFNDSVVALTLNRVESLNALNTPLIMSLQRHLKKLEANPNITAIVLNSSISKAFCAGGDIVEVCQNVRKGKIKRAKQFFRQEYDTHVLLRSMKTPVIGIAEGFSIGGGLGLLNSCTYKIITETSQVSMPEAMIGFFPDAGASNFLSSTEFGLFLGLSSQRIKASDILLCKLADYYIPSEKLQSLLIFLSTNFISGDKKDLENQLSFLQEGESLSSGPLEKNKSYITKLSQVCSIEEFDKELNLYEGEDPWILRAIENFNYSSKHSLKFIFNQLKQNRNWELNNLFDKEYKMAMYFASHPDLLEGVRAFLEDKDKKPQWKESSYKNITIPKEILKELES